MVDATYWDRRQNSSRVDFIYDKLVYIEFLLFGGSGGGTVKLVLLMYGHVGSVSFEWWKIIENIYANGK